jgi:hypothetical protein
MSKRTILSSVIALGLLMLPAHPVQAQAAGGGQAGDTSTGTTSTGSTSTGTTSTGSTSTSMSTMNQQSNSMPGDYATANQFIASGAIGGSFGGDTSDGSFGFDGALDYLHQGKYGFEFLGAFTPNLEVGNVVSVNDNQVNSYMFNVIGAGPMGTSGSWLPYVSAGIGVITLRSDINSNVPTTLPLVDDNQFGANLGIGLMGFRDQIGFRADFRYFTGIGNEGDINNVGGTLNGLVNDVNFWRSTVGVSFRW